MCAYIYISTISEERGYEFERAKRGIWEDLEGEREKACNYIRVSKKLKKSFLKTQYIRG